MKTFYIRANVILECEKVIRAETEEDALERASELEGDEWMHAHILSEKIRDIEATEQEE